MLGCVFTKMISILSTVFLNLFISSFYDSSNEGQQEAKRIAAIANGISMTIAIVACFVAGYLSDKIKPSTLLVCAFCLSTSGAVVFSFIPHPSSPILQIAVILFNMGSMS
jgi:MFS family permease